MFKLLSVAIHIIFLVSATKQLGKGLAYPTDTSEASFTHFTNILLTLMVVQINTQHLQLNNALNL